MNARFKCGCSFDVNSDKIMEELDWVVGTINLCKKHHSIIRKRIEEVTNINLV